MVKDRKVIAISGTTAEILEKRQKASKSKSSFAEFVDEYLQIHLEKDEFLRTFAPSISKIGITDNILYLKDAKKNKVVEIRLVKGVLQSNDDNPIYTQFAMALPELAKLK